MNPDLTIEDVIAQIGEEGAFRFFTYTTEEYPLDPRGWDGLAHLARYFGDFERASAYAERSTLLSSGGYQPAWTSENSKDDQFAYAGSENRAYDSKTNLPAKVGMLFLGLGMCCCVVRIGCAGRQSELYSAPVATTPIASQPTTAPSTRLSKRVLKSEIRSFTPPGISFPIPDGWTAESMFHVLDDRDSIELRSTDGSGKVLRIEVNHAKPKSSARKTVEGYARDFTKAYKRNYVLEAVSESEALGHSFAMWQFRQKQNGVWKYKRDCLFDLSDGRRVAVLLITQSPQTSEDTSDQEQLVRGIQPLK